MCSFVTSASTQTGLADEKPFARDRGDVFGAFWVGGERQWSLREVNRLRKENDDAAW